MHLHWTKEKAKFEAQIVVVILWMNAKSIKVQGKKGGEREREKRQKYTYIFLNC